MAANTMLLRVRIAALFLMFASPMLSACAGAPKPIGNAGGKLIAISALPEPDGVDAAGKPVAYRLGPDDLLSITVLGREEASLRQVRIDKGGSLSVPVIGVVEAGGLSLKELESLILARLRAAFYRNPQVTIALLDADSARITVDGAVAKPGIYPARANMTLIQAIAAAEGVKETAQLNDVAIFRTVNGQKYGALYDLRAIRRGNYADPLVFQGDTITVGSSSARRLFAEFVQIIPLLTTPIVVAFQNN